ncbi:MAG: hypothetical protein HRT89_22580 [Lentisphaeria bacterium]|nr:hypothetical protein [Lentisphaeria bacterium]NQZ70846.1 hypothetical protein [Lentisphaeria bacterium]
MENEPEEESGSSSKKAKPTRIAIKGNKKAQRKKARQRQERFDELTIRATKLGMSIVACRVIWIMGTIYMILNIVMSFSIGLGFGAVLIVSLVIIAILFIFFELILAKNLLAFRPWARTLGIIVFGLLSLLLISALVTVPALIGLLDSKTKALFNEKNKKEPENELSDETV